jgi:DNA-directed RNA polymerase subunit M/transcription elongation factor TFIIS
MKCFYCDTELVWQSDTDNEDGGITSFYVCPNCNAEYEINK